MRFYRNNAQQFFQALLWPTVFLTLAKILFQWGITHGSLRFDSKDWGGVVLAGAFVVVGFLGLIVTSFFIQLRQMAFIRMANGFAETYREAYQFISGRKWRILGLGILGLLGFVGLFVFWMIEVSISTAFIKSGKTGAAVSAFGIGIGSFGMIVSFIIFALVAYMAYPVVACEDRSIGAWISRSFKLLFKDFWRALGFAILLAVAISLVSYPLSLPMVLLAVFEFFRQGMSAEYLTDPSKTPFYWMVLNQTWESIINVILWPVTFLGFGLFYYDLRMRQEAIDLVQRVELIEKEQSPKESSSPQVSQ